MEAAAKEALLMRFGAYLDELDNLPSEPTEPDQFSVVSELVALKSEVKIEARQVKTALDLFRETFELLRQTHSKLEADLGRQREHESRIRQETERTILVELLDLRDRLQAGYTHLTNYRPSWFARHGGAIEYIAEIATGQSMLLRRLDEILARRDVQILSTIDEHFDPTIMTAVQTAQDYNKEDGIVVEETRAGFMYHGQLLRPSEVIVNKIAKFL